MDCVPGNDRAEEGALVVVAADEDGGGEVEGEGARRRQARDILGYPTYHLKKNIHIAYLYITVKNYALFVLYCRHFSFISIKRLYSLHRN